MTSTQSIPNLFNDANEEEPVLISNVEEASGSLCALTQGIQ
jgi:hypothetical protein